jgi:hypothetical protein
LSAVAIARTEFARIRARQPLRGPNAREFGPDSMEFGPNSREFDPDSMEFGPNAREFGSDSREFGPNSREFGPDSREFGSDAREFACRGFGADRTRSNSNAAAAARAVGAGAARPGLWRRRRTCCGDAGVAAALVWKFGNSGSWKLCRRDGLPIRVDMRANVSVAPPPQTFPDGARHADRAAHLDPRPQALEFKLRRKIIGRPYGRGMHDRRRHVL